MIKWCRFGFVFFIIIEMLFFWFCFLCPVSAASSSLVIRCGQTGVSVYVNSTDYGSTNSGGTATINGLSAGTYTLKLTKIGFKDWMKQVNINDGQTTNVYAYLEVGTGNSTTRNEIVAPNSNGKLEVNVGVSAVSIYLNGEYGGSSDATVNGLVAGIYTLKLSKMGYKEWTKQVNITQGQTTNVYAYLESGTGASVTRNEIISYNSAFGYLRVYSGQSNVNIYVENEYGGYADSKVNGLLPGIYNLKLSKIGYKDWTKQFCVDSSKTTIVYAALENGTGESFTRNEIIYYNSSFGYLSVEAGQAGVGLYINGEFGGETASGGSKRVDGLIAGTYTLKLSKNSYKDWTKHIIIGDDQGTTVHAFLENGGGVSMTRNETISYNSPFGSLRIYSGQSGASVYIGGELSGTADSLVSWLIEGIYSLKLNNTIFKDWTKQVIITAGQTTNVYISLEQGTGTSIVRNETLAYNSPFGSLRISAGQNGVSVYVGEEYGGVTLSNERKIDGLIQGNYTLRLSKNGYKDWTGQVFITIGQTTTVNAALIASAPPIAGFSYNNSNLKSGVSIIFRDSSVGIVTSWSWSFSDGYTSTSQNVTHTFSKEGTYTISLTVFNSAGNSTISKQVTIAASSSSSSSFDSNMWLWLGILGIVVFTITYAAYAIHKKNPKQPAITRGSTPTPKPNLGQDGTIIFGSGGSSAKGPAYIKLQNGEIRCGTCGFINNTNAKCCKNCGTQF